MAGFALYRFYGDAGALLYVGITDNPDRRWKEHSKSKDWWPEVRGITIDWYETRQAVEAAERRAVAVEQPAHNKALRRKVIGLPASRPEPTLADWTSEEVLDLFDLFECAWTSRWWEDPDLKDESTSRYRHDGRRYAHRPAGWESTVFDLYRRGLTPDAITRAVVDAWTTKADEVSVWDEFTSIAEMNAAQVVDGERV